MPKMPARRLLVLVLAATGFHAEVFSTQDRSIFETATAKLCIRSVREDPANAQRPDSALTAYCACYASEMARIVPSDILNTSQSAATPQQAKALRQLAEQAGEACGSHLR